MEGYDNLKTKLQTGKSKDIKCINQTDIDKIEEISINTNLSKQDRIINFLKKVKNPYIFMIDGAKVKFEYAEKGLNLNQCLENLIDNRIRS